MTFDIPDAIPRGALITGGSGQTALFQALTGAGFAVALQFEPAGGKPLPAGAIAMPADLRDEAQTTTLLARATAAIGPIGVLINAAGASGGDAWDEPTRGAWDLHFATNARAPFLLIQQFAKALPPAGEGVAINLLDQRVNPSLMSYAASNAALWSLTQAMALALAPRIRVNGIATGPTSRPSVGNRGGTAAERGGKPDAIARAALAILALRSMTGQMIVPDGVPPPPA